MEFITNSPEETERVGAALGAVLAPGSILAYEGDLGAGKTAFTRGLARGLGATEQVTSPTYTIVNEYLSGRMPLFHFDMYRIEDDDELYSMGYYDYVDSGAYCIVEWSENIESSIPSDAIFVTISRCEDDENKRNINIDF